MTCVVPGLSSKDSTYLLMKLEFLAMELAEKAGFDGITAPQMHVGTVVNGSFATLTMHLLFYCERESFSASYVLLTFSF